MTRISIIIVTVFLTAGWVAELSAQTPNPATPNVATSASRRASLFSGSRVTMFSSEGGLNVERGDVKSKSLTQNDPLKDMLIAYDPSMVLSDPSQSNMSLFSTVGGAMQRVLGVDLAAPIPIDTGSGLAISTIDTEDINLTPTIGRSRMYPPRLRFMPNPEDLAELQKPEIIAELEVADRKRAAELVADINDKFDLPKSADISLEFDGLMVLIQGRVPNPTARQQIGMYLSFEPGIYSIQNDLVIDPSVLDLVVAPTIDVDPAP